MNITKIFAREILDSRGNPTVQVDVHTGSGAFGRASVPSGASTGEREALELRDGDAARYGGRGVRRAVENVNSLIAPYIVGMSVAEQRAIDRTMCALDGTPSRSRLGANAILGVSLAVAHCAADYFRMPLYRYLGGATVSVLPLPMMNILNGGAHSDSPIAFQEFMIRPIAQTTFAERLRMGVEVFHALRSVLRGRGLSTAVGDEGGFAPALLGVEDAVETILEAVVKAGFTPRRDITLALDCAASEFYREGMYDYRAFEGVKAPCRTTDEQIDYLARLVDAYPIDSVEDGLSQNDWAGWQRLTERIGARCQTVGDDLFVTNTEYLRRGIEEHSATAILIKPNQIGTLTETLDCVRMAQQAGLRTIISHRSGETEDTTIADIAVATSAGQIKTGSASRGERTAKYNRLLQIEEELSADRATYQS